MKYRLSPSILAVDFGRLAAEIANVEKAGASYLHFDVMDGHFVPSISFGMPVLRAVRACTRLPLDVHLMIEEPERYLRDFRESGADLITVHVEAVRHLHRIVTEVRELGARAGVALNPATPLCMLDYILSEVDLVLIMSVNPGFGGQEFIPASLGKIRELKRLREERGLSFEIEVDGGIGLSNAQDVIRAGADVIVAGTSVFGGDIGENVRGFQKIFEACEKESLL